MNTRPTSGEEQVPEVCSTTVPVTDSAAVDWDSRNPGCGFGASPEGHRPTRARNVAMPAMVRTVAKILRASRGLWRIGLGLCAFWELKAGVAELAGWAECLFVEGEGEIGRCFGCAAGFGVEACAFAEGRAVARWLGICGAGTCGAAEALGVPCERLLGRELVRELCERPAGRIPISGMPNELRLLTWLFGVNF